MLKKSSQNWYSFDCPMCVDGENKKKMAVHFGYQLVKCWVCEYRERAIQFIMDTEGGSYRDILDLINHFDESGISEEFLATVHIAEAKPLQLPYGYQSLLEGKGNLSDRARNYLAGRGFDLEELDMKGFGYVKEHPPTDSEEDYFGYIIIPFKRDGEFIYFIGRDFLNNGTNFLRYKNPPKDMYNIGKSDLVYNEEALKLRKHVFITEGWSCAETMGKAGIATLGWSLSTMQKSIMLSGVSNEFTFLPDKGFYKQAVKTAAQFLQPDRTIKVVNLDNWEGEGKDPNEIGRKEIMKLVKKTNPLEFSNVMQILVE